jgi:hypothetical protein
MNATILDKQTSDKVSFITFIIPIIFKLLQWE